MNLKKMHESLNSSVISRNQTYSHEAGSAVLSACTLVRYALNNLPLADKTTDWPTLVKSDPHVPLLLSSIQIISKNYPVYAELFASGLNACNNIALFTFDEISLILAYANNVNSKDVNQLLDVVEDLNNVLGTESDNIVKQLTPQNSPTKITSFGFRILTYLQTNLKANFTSYHMDHLRWREAILSKIILDRKNDEVILGNFTDQVLPKWLSQDYVFISANRSLAKLPPQHLAELCKELNHTISNQKSSLSLNELGMIIPNSDVYFAHIILALKLIKQSGKVFLTIRFAAWQSKQLQPLQRYLIDNNKVERIIFIKTSRIDPWILICLSNAENNQVYMLGENFYTSGGLKYRLNNLTTTRIVKAVNDKDEIKNICGNISLATIQTLNYNLDPNVCLNFSNHYSIEKNAQNISNLCSKIFRGPGIYNDDISKEPASSNYFMIGHTALTEDGLDSNNLTPIPEYLYLEHATNYAIYPGDIVMLSRATTNRVVLIPEGNIKYLANINLLILRPDPKTVNPIYLYLLLNSPKGKSLLSSIEKGVTLKSISIKDLKNLPISITDFTTQQEIADKYVLERQTLNQAKERFYKFIREVQNNII